MIMGSLLSLVGLNVSSSSPQFTLSVRDKLQFYIYTFCKVALCPVLKVKYKYNTVLGKHESLHLAGNHIFASYTCYKERSSSGECGGPAEGCHRAPFSDSSRTTAWCRLPTEAQPYLSPSGCQHASCQQSGTY